MIPKKYIMNMIFNENAEIQRAYASYWYLVGDDNFTEVIFDENWNYLTVLWSGIEQWGGLAGGWGIDIQADGTIDKGEFYELYISETQKKVDCPNIITSPIWKTTSHELLLCKIDEWDGNGHDNNISIDRNGKWKYKYGKQD